VWNSGNVSERSRFYPNTGDLQCFNGCEQCNTVNI
jgi:hypothetical protein